MSISQTKIYNLALSALLLSKEISNVDTDQSNEVRVFNTHWDIALESTIQDLDLDSLSQPVVLELLADLSSEDDEPYNYVYKYPSKCVFLRRLKSGFETDNRLTHISKRTGIYNGQKAIYTNQEKAIGECMTNDIPLIALSPMAAMAVSYRLAKLSAPLIVGKGAQRLREKLEETYMMYKLEAQEYDAKENFNYESDYQRSEFVAARLE